MKRLASLLFVAVALALPVSASAQTSIATPYQLSVQTSLTVGTSAATYTSGTAGATIRTALGDFRIGANGQLVSRKGVTFCSSKNASNPASALVTVRLDGTNPTTASSDPGVVLAVGDCVFFPISGNVVPKLISTQANTIILVFEGV